MALRTDNLTVSLRLKFSQKEGIVNKRNTGRNGVTFAKPVTKLKRNNLIAVSASPRRGNLNQSAQNFLIYSSKVICMIKPLSFPFFKKKLTTWPKNNYFFPFAVNFPPHPSVKTSHFVQPLRGPPRMYRMLFNT